MSGIAVVSFKLTDNSCPVASISKSIIARGYNNFFFNCFISDVEIYEAPLVFERLLLPAT